MTRKLHNLKKKRNVKEINLKAIIEGKNSINHYSFMAYATSISSPIQVVVYKNNCSPEQIKIIEESLEKGGIRNVKWWEEKDDSIISLFKMALRKLNSSESTHENWSIKKSYDYAWIYKALQEPDLIPNIAPVIGRKLYFKGFEDYIRNLNLIKEDNWVEIPNSANIRKSYHEAYGEFPWSYQKKDRTHYSQTEVNRRNAIVETLVSR